MTLLRSPPSHLVLSLLTTLPKNLSHQKCPATGRRSVRLPGGRLPSPCARRSFSVTAFYSGSTQSKQVQPFASSVGNGQERASSWQSSPGTGTGPATVQGQSLTACACVCGDVEGVAGGRSHVACRLRWHRNHGRLSSEDVWISVPEHRVDSMTFIAWNVFLICN